MRTTLDIDEDVLGAAKELASHYRETTGKIISQLARDGIRHQRESKSRRRKKNGFEVIPADGRVVTDDLVRKLAAQTPEV